MCGGGINDARLLRLVLNALRAPQVVASSHVEHLHLQRAGHLVGDVERWSSASASKPPPK